MAFLYFVLLMLILFLTEFPATSYAEDSNDGQLYSEYILDIQDSVTVNGKSICIYAALRNLPWFSKRHPRGDYIFSDDMSTYITPNGRTSNGRQYTFTDNRGSTNISDRGTVGLAFNDRVLFMGWEVGSRITSSTGTVLHDFEANMESARYLRASNQIIVHWMTGPTDILDLNGNKVHTFENENSSFINVSNDGSYVLFSENPNVSHPTPSAENQRSDNPEDSYLIEKDNAAVRTAPITPSSTVPSVWGLEVATLQEIEYSFPQDYLQKPTHRYISTLFGSPILIYADTGGDPDLLRLRYCKPNQAKGTIPYATKFSSRYYKIQSISENFAEDRLLIILHGDAPTPTEATCYFLEVDSDFNVVNEKEILFQKSRENLGLDGVIAGNYIITNDFAGTVRILSW